MIFHESEQRPLRERVFLEPQRLVNVMKELMHHDLSSRCSIAVEQLPNVHELEVSEVMQLGGEFVRHGVLDRRLPVAVA